MILDPQCHEAAVELAAVNKMIYAGLAEDEDYDSEDDFPSIGDPAHELGEDSQSDTSGAYSGGYSPFIYANFT